MSEESGDNLTQDNASLGRIVRDVSRILNELRHVDVVGRKASDFRDEL